LTIIGENDGCFSNESEGIIILFQSPPDIKAQVFDDLLIACAADEFLSLESFNGPPEVDVKWSALTPGVLINNENSVSALASNFLPGENLIKLSYSKDGCNDFSSDTVSVFLEPSPMLEDDEFNIAFNSSSTIDIFNNDALPENLEFSYNDNGIKGMFIDNGTTLTFIPDEGLVGTFTFEYEVCVQGCPSLCENALVTLNIGLDHECGIPSIFTPNQDGINDYFIIPCLDSDRYDKNKLFIFNEWGDEVFSASPYDNSWDGTYGGEPLPVGTYFIVFEPGEGTAPIRGFLMLQR
jgi:gliding motility-associated-like protein